MIPDYQKLMRPVLECVAEGEVPFHDLVKTLGGKLELEQRDLEKSRKGGQARVLSDTLFYSRVNFATSYLRQAVLLEGKKGKPVVITNRGLEALANNDAIIDNNYLKNFKEFQDFIARSRKANKNKATDAIDIEATSAPPGEILRSAHQRINAELSVELLQRVQEAPPEFFEKMIIELLLAMGYGGAWKDAGRVRGGSGDGGVDGVIHQDPLGVDQIYIQAKRYADDRKITPSDIRGFAGSLDAEGVQKGIFATTSSFTKEATKQVEKASSRIVLIDGTELTRLMIHYNIGCREEDTLYLKEIDEDFFE